MVQTIAEKNESLVVKRLGEYMLGGWVLTDSTCKDCVQTPLVRSKDSRNWVCVLCDMDDEAKKQTASIKDITVTSTLQKSKLSQSIISDEEESISKNSDEFTDKEIEEDNNWDPKVESEAQKKSRIQKDKVSGLLSDKMLQGWTLLNDECPNVSCSGIPLVSNRKKERFCVNCSHFIQYTSDGSSSVKAKPTTPVPENMVELDANEIGSKILSRIPQKNVSVPGSSPLPKKQRTSSISSIQISEDLMFNVKDTLISLNKTLADLNRQLVSSTLDSQNLESIGRTCQVIAQCGSAIQSLKQCIDSSE